MPPARTAVLPLAVLAALGSGVSAAGCGVNYGPGVWYCIDQHAADREHYAADGTFDPCHCFDPEGPSKNCPIEVVTDAGADAPIPEPECAGRCLPIQPLEWEPPALLWIGAESDAPPCPDLAPAIGYEGHADLLAPALTCGACSCEPPTGSCDLPATLTASSLSQCPNDGPGAILTPFDPPSGWDGSCTTHDAMPPGAHSLTIAPLTVNESACTPSPSSAPPGGAVTWSTFARACIGIAAGTCMDPGQVCSAAASRAGFRTCVAQRGDVVCPSFSPYADRHVFHGSADDTRGCSPCMCGAPDGSACSALISAYSDNACSASALLLSVLVDASAPLCAGLSTGALGSKSAGPPSYTPGTCPPSGGDATGAITPTLPSTFCCLPEDVPL